MSITIFNAMKCKLLNIGLLCILFVVGCGKAKSEINLYKTVLDENSILLDVVTCDEKSVTVVDNWLWTDKTISQDRDDDLEFASCIMYGYSETDNKYLGSLRYLISKYDMTKVLQ